MTDDPATKSMSQGDDEKSLPPAGSQDPNVGRRIGRFHIKSVIASGGMGTVYLAMQEEPRRHVALKLMKHGIASRSALRRFKFEAQLLARLRHPGIAQIYESGTHDDGSGGVPYFAFEYIPGALPLTTYAKERKLDIGERLDLFAKVCDAVAHGHQKGIIHRDLKPANILVDSQGRPKIIDFGVARATDSDLAVTTLQTDLHQIIGTLQYMSPEQCGNDALDIDTSSDVYALGVVLYELLCDQLPYDISDSLLPAAVETIRTQEPARPSTINRSLKGDLETIVLKALNKGRDRRYRTAADFGDDIRRYLNDEAIVARPPSAAYQIRLFARRNRAAFTASVAIAGVLVIATAVSLIFGVLALRARAAAQRESYVANIMAADAALQIGATMSAQLRLEEAPKHLRGWEWSYLSSVGDKSIRTLTGHSTVVDSVTYSPDGELIASASRDHTIRLWNASSGVQVSVLNGDAGPVYDVAFSSDGTRLASGSGDGSVIVWDTHTREALAKLEGHEGHVHAVAFSRDGAYLASASHDETIRVWDVASGQTVTTIRLPESGWPTMAFSLDGTRIVQGSYQGTIRVWDRATGSELSRSSGHRSPIWSVAFSPDGARIASASEEGAVRVWDTDTCELMMTLEGHQGRVQAVEFDAEGRRIVSASQDNTIRIWDATTGTEIATLIGHRALATSVAFSPDGRRIVSSHGLGSVRIWDAEAGDALDVLRGHTGAVESVALSPDGTRAVSGSTDGTVRVWDLIAGREVVVLRGHFGPVRTVAFSRDGTRFASGSVHPTIRVWDATTGASISAPHGHTGRVNAVAFSPDGSRLASAGNDNTARIWDPSTGQEIRKLGSHLGDVNAVAWSPRGRWIATGSSDGRVRVFDASSGKLVKMLRPKSRINAVAFDLDGTRLAAASGRIVEVWKTGSWKRAYKILAHDAEVNALNFGPDGRLVSGGEDRLLKLWDAATGKGLLTLRGHNEAVLCVAFVGTRLASGAKDGVVRVWDSVPWRERLDRRMEALRAAEAAKPIVDALFVQGRGPAAIAAQVSSDELLGEPLRRAALNRVIHRARYRSIDDPAVAAMIEKHQRRLDQLKQVYLYGTFDVRWTDKRGEHQFERGVDFEIWLEPPYWMAGRASKLGEVLWLLGTDERQYWLFDLSSDERILYSGDRHDDPIPERTVVLAVLDVFGLTRLDHENLRGSLVAVAPERQSWIISARGFGDPVRVHLDPSRGVPTSIELLNDDEGVRAFCHLSEYQPVEGATADAAAPLMPRRIVILRPSVDFQVEVSLEGVVVDDPDQRWDLVFDFERLYRKLKPDRVEGNLLEVPGAPGQGGQDPG